MQEIGERLRRPWTFSGTSAYADPRALLRAYAIVALDAPIVRELEGSREATAPRFEHP